jgi:hypothetical protein
MHGAVNLAGKEIIPLGYEFMKPFHSRLSATKSLGKWGYLDSLGNVAIPFLYDDAWNFESEIAQLRIGFEFFHIDRKGERI